MNLIQIKQIDGLTTTLNSLARGLFDLEEEVTGQFERAFEIYDELDIVRSGDERYINIKSPGADIREEDVAKYINNTGDFLNVKVKIEDGSLLVEEDVYTDKINCNQINCDSFTASGSAQLSSVTSSSYIYEDSNTGRQTDVFAALQPNYKSFDITTAYPVYLDVDDEVAVFYNNQANGIVSEIVLPGNPTQGKEVLIKVVGTGLTAENGNVFMIRPENSNHKIEGNQNWGINWDYGYAKLLYLGDVSNEWVITSSNFGRFNYASAGPTPDPVNGPTNPFNVLSIDLEYVNAQFPIQQGIIDTMSGLVDQLSGQVYDVSTELNSVTQGLDSVIADVDLISGNCC